MRRADIANDYDAYAANNMNEKPPIHLEDRVQEGARKFSPTAARNRGPIGEVLSPLIPPKTRVLEIASGTGEHALHMCQLRPDITWQPTDPDSGSRASQNSWAAELHRQEAEGNMATSLNVDVTQPDWPESVPSFDLIYCANMIHIAPWAAAEGLACGAQSSLPSGGTLILYGPFMEGAETAPSNFDFDVSLKSRNPDWGVRDIQDVKHIFELHGFNHTQRTAMPKNNQILVFKRA